MITIIHNGKVARLNSTDEALAYVAGLDTPVTATPAMTPRPQVQTQPPVKMPVQAVVKRTYNRGVVKAPPPSSRSKPGYGGGRRPYKLNALQQKLGAHQRVNLTALKVPTKYQPLVAALVEAGTQSIAVNVMVEKGLVPHANQLPGLAMWFRRLELNVGRGKQNDLLRTIREGKESYWMTTSKFAEIYYSKIMRPVATPAPTPQPQQPLPQD